MSGRRNALLLAGVAAVALAQPVAAQQGAQRPQPAAPAQTSPAAAPAVPTVPVRAGNHEDYVRLVFDWPQGVDYVVDRSGPLVTLRFSRPGRADLEQARRSNPRGITALDQVPDDGGMKVSFVTAPDATLRHFKAGQRVVVDVLQPRGAQPAQTTPQQAAQAQTGPAPQPAARQAPPTTQAQGAPAQPATAQPATGQPAAQGGPPAQAAPIQLTPEEMARRAREGAPLHEIRRAQAAAPAPGTGPAATPAQPQPQQAASPQPQQAAPPRTAQQQPPAPRPGATQPAAAQPATTQPAATPATAGPVPLTPPPAAQVAAQPASAGPQPPVPATAQPAAPAAQAPAVQAPAVQAPPAATAPPARAAQAAPAPAVAATPDQGAGTPAAAMPENLSVAVDPGETAALAVFERAGFLYILFDRELPEAAVPQIAPAEGLGGPVERLTHPLGTGFRFAMPLVLEPTVERDGTLWRVTMRRPGEAEASGSLPVTSEPEFALGPRLVVKSPDAGEVIKFTDPVVGDTLQVVPLPVPGQRIAAPLRFKEAQFLPTAQGVVIRGVDDRLLVQAVRDGVEVTVPGGLRLSPAEDVAAALPPPPPKEPDSLYDYADWGLTPARNIIRERQNRWNALGELPADDRARGRLDLARFYVANGFGPEALGLLDLVLEEQPDLDRRPEFRAVRGAARLLSGDAPGAARDLRHRSLDNEPDARIWRAAATAVNGDWPTAHTQFTDVMDQLREYPEPLFSRLGLLAVEAMLRAGDTAAAQRLLDRMDRRDVDEGPRAAAYSYFRGEAARQAGDAAAAKKAWEPLLTSTDHFYRTRAQKDLIELRLANQEIDAKRAAELMERLRFAWRGDQLELAINRRLGELHVAAGNYATGFDTMRRTVSLFPDDPQAAEITKDLSDTFANLFIKDGAAHLPPLEALALYEQYRELTPPGPNGDALIRRLAERLVEIDLLDRAAELLDHQVQFRLSGLEKSQVGTRLAGIRLLNVQPDEAIAALDRSEQPGLPPELAEERRLLRARALSQTDRSGDAVKLLAADQSRPANLLRIDIAWRDRQWSAAAQALADIIGPPPAAGQALEAEIAKLVVNRAVALALAQDTPALNRLRDEFGPAMEQTREATAFRVLTRPQESAGLVDAATIQSRMAEIDMFRSFLDSYRTRQEAAAPAAAPPPAPTVN